MTESEIRMLTRLVAEIGHFQDNRAALLARYSGRPVGDLPTAVHEDPVTVQNSPVLRLQADVRALPDNTKPDPFLRLFEALDGARPFGCEQIDRNYNLVAAALRRRQAFKHLDEAEHDLSQQEAELLTAQLLSATKLSLAQDALKHEQAVHEPLQGLKQVLSASLGLTRQA